MSPWHTSCDTRWFSRTEWFPQQPGKHHRLLKHLTNRFERNTKTHLKVISHPEMLKGDSDDYDLWPPNKNVLLQRLCHPPWRWPVYVSLHELWHPSKGRILETSVWWILQAWFSLPPPKDLHSTHSYPRHPDYSHIHVGKTVYLFLITASYIQLYSYICPLISFSTSSCVSVVRPLVLQ